MLRGVATNSVKIVTCAPAWQVLPGWVHSVTDIHAASSGVALSSSSAKNKPTSTATNNDDDSPPDVSLSLCPGETRREVVSLRRILGECGDKDCDLCLWLNLLCVQVKIWTTCSLPVTQIAK